MAYSWCSVHENLGITDGGNDGLTDLLKKMFFKIPSGIIRSRVNKHGGKFIETKKRKTTE